MNVIDEERMVYRGTEILNWLHPPEVKNQPKNEREEGGNLLCYFFPGMVIFGSTVFTV